MMEVHPVVVDASKIKLTQKGHFKMGKQMFLVLVTVAMLLMSSVGVQAAGGNGTGVYVNGDELTPQLLYRYESHYGQRLLPGYYWRDQNGALWIIRLIGTGVYVNNQELTPSQLYQLEAYYGRLKPGYYWRDSYNNLQPVTRQTASKSSNDDWIVMSGSCTIASDGVVC